MRKLSKAEKQEILEDNVQAAALMGHLTGIDEEEEMSTTEIVKPPVEIIPRPNLEGVETAIAKLSTETEKLASLRTRAEELIKTAGKLSANDFLQAAKLLQLEVRSIGKAAGLNLDVYWEVVKRVSNALSDIYEKHEGQAKAIDDTLKIKVKEVEAEEKRRAEIEAARINRERIEAAEKKAKEEREERERLAKIEKDRKIGEIRGALKRKEIGKREAARMLKEAGAIEEARLAEASADADAQVQAVKDNPVKVEADIPKVAGVPSRTNYKAEVKDEDLIIDAYVRAVVKEDTERAVYLRKFIAVDEQEIGSEARRVKDPKKLESLIPGIHAYAD